jgi:hypothetical protein
LRGILPRGVQINKTAQEYRQLAEQCRKLAGAVSAASERADLLAKAQVWQVLAARVERVPR